MRRTVVEDRWGQRWTVRARYERHAEMESDYTRRLREPELRGHLEAALLPTAPHRVGGRPHSFDRPAPGYRAHAAGIIGAQAAALGSPIGALLSIFVGIRYLNRPSNQFWVVELYARGRLRRGATWRFPGQEEAAVGAAAVAQAVRTGAPIEPADAQLIDVVDQRLTVYGAAR